MIVIGTDTHKRTHTAVAVVAGTGELQGELTARALPGGFVEMLGWAQGLDGERVWAIEDCRHVSAGFERFLVARGERVVRVAPKLMVASRRGARSVWASPTRSMLSRLLVQRSLRVQGCCLRRTRRIRELQRELGALVAAKAPQLLELPGCGALSAARIVGDLGDVTRFASDAKLARLAGVAPVPVSSGLRDRHRLDRGGNRKLNCAFHRLAVTQGRIHPQARDYLARKQAEGRTRMDALRCLKRHLVRRVFLLLTQPNTTSPALKTTPALT